MADERMRKLERAAASGDVEAALALDRARDRAGLKTPESAVAALHTATFDVARAQNALGESCNICRGNGSYTSYDSFQEWTETKTCPTPHPVEWAYEVMVLKKTLEEAQRALTRWKSAFVIHTRDEVEVENPRARVKTNTGRKVEVGERGVVRSLDSIRPSYHTTTHRAYVFLPSGETFRTALSNLRVCDPWASWKRLGPEGDEENAIKDAAILALCQAMPKHHDRVRLTDGREAVLFWRDVEGDRAGVRESPRSEPIWCKLSELTLVRPLPPG